MDISYLATTLEHCTKDLLKVCEEKLSFVISMIFLKLANDYVSRLGKNEITANDIDLVMNADTVEIHLMIKINYFRLFKKIFLEILRSDVNSAINPSTTIYNIDTSLATMSYNELIRHFIITETQYKDDLELLIKLFRNPIRNFFTDQPEV
jgi:hypothetical protein